MVTSDNSRHEDPAQICTQIMAGFHKPEKVVLESDRAMAILQTVLAADPNDVILIAGKGHENYQEINGEKHFFSDKEHALSALQRRCAT
jgi:UDP-N-acetylmuramyl tripeptide synthase